MSDRLYFTSAESRRVEALIDACNGDSRRAARILGVSRESLFRLMYGGRCWERTVLLARGRLAHASTAFNFAYVLPGLH